jgi:hypothetical protein
MEFLDTLWLTVMLVTFYIGFPVLIYIYVPVAIWSMESFTNFPNTSIYGADEIKIRKARIVCIAVFYGLFLVWWFVEYLWEVLMKTYEPGGLF